MAAEYHAEGDSIDYLPSGAAVTAGQVIDLGDFVGIATSPIADGVLGSLRIEGVFKVDKKDSDSGWTLGAPLYYDAGTTSFTSDSSYSEAAAGVAVPDSNGAMAGASDATGYIKLTPGIARS